MIAWTGIVNDPRSLACGSVPQPDGVIVAGRNQCLAVRREDQCSDFLNMSRQSSQFRAVGHVPEPDRIVISPGSQQLAIGADGHRVDRA